VDLTQFGGHLMIKQGGVHDALYLFARLLLKRWDQTKFPQAFIQGVFGSGRNARKQAHFDMI